MHRRNNLLQYCDTIIVLAVIVRLTQSTGADTASLHAVEQCSESGPTHRKDEDGNALGRLLLTLKKYED